MSGVFTRDRRGGIAVIAAGAVGLVCVLAALTIDLASIALHARRLQGAADLAALSGARNLQHADAAARATAFANLGPGVEVTVLTGRYRSDWAIAPTLRFTREMEADAGPNAVRVMLNDATPLYFGRWIVGRSTVNLSRSATAAATVAPPQAMFSIGSRLASLDGGAANQLLTALTGSQVSLSVMDYEALASAQVNLLQFSDALATELGLEAGDYDGLLERTVDAGRALKVLEDLAGDHADSALSKLVRPADGVDVRLGDLIGIAARAEDGLSGALDTSVSVMDLAMAMLEIGGGDRQVALNLGARPGLADLKVSLAIGERPNRAPWLTVTDKGAPIIRTAQARLYIRARTAQKLAGLAQVNLPILIELASSEARLQDIACEPGRTVTLGVRPGLAKASIGAIDEARLDDFTRPLTPTPATVLSILGLDALTARAEVEAADQSFTAVRFSDSDIRTQAKKTVQARGLVNGIVVSLLQRMDVRVLGLGTGALAQALGTLLAPLGPVLDGVVNPVLDMLGLKFGEADVIVHGATCPEAGGRPTLVG